MQSNTLNIYRFFPWLSLVLAISLLVGVILNAPPQAITIEAGPKGGFFDTTALMLKSKLKEHDIKVNIINSEDTLQIIKNINNPSAAIDVGFIVHEVPLGKYDNVKSLGSITMDPLFIFVRNGLKLDSPDDFVGLKLGVGPLNTSGRVATDEVLSLYNISPSNAAYIPLSLMDMAAAIKNGDVDVAFFLQPSSNDVVAQIGSSGVATLMSLNYAEAITKKFGYLHYLTISPGSFNATKHLPPEQIKMIGIPVTVIAKSNLHPAVATQLAIVLKSAFRSPTLVTVRGEFPTMGLETDLNEDSDAAKIYSRGTGFLPTIYKVFNFWIAGVIDKLALLLSVVLGQ